MQHSQIVVRIRVWQQNQRLYSCIHKYLPFNCITHKYSPLLPKHHLLHLTMFSYCPLIIFMICLSSILSICQNHCTIFSPVNSSFVHFQINYMIHACYYAHNLRISSINHIFNVVQQTPNQRRIERFLFLFALGCYPSNVKKRKKRKKNQCSFLFHVLITYTTAATTTASYNSNRPIYSCCFFAITYFFLFLCLVNHNQMKGKHMFH